MITTRTVLPVPSSYRRGSRSVSACAPCVAHSCHPRSPDSALGSAGRSQSCSAAAETQ